MIRPALARLIDIRAIAMGTAVATGASLLAFALALFGFGNVYYASVFMPFLMMMCLAVAWFMVLRRDGLAGRPAETSPIPGLGSQPEARAPAGVEPGSPLFAPRDNGIIPRAPLPSGSIPAPRKSVSGSAVLLWAAIEIGIFATILYSAAGVGAGFH